MKCKIKEEYQDGDENVVYDIVEDNGDRLVISTVLKGWILPIKQTVKREMIEIIE